MTIQGRPAVQSPSSVRHLGAKGSTPPSLVETSKSAARFRPLFNGKDLSGWKTHPNQRDQWRVENGVLIGSGPTVSHLYTDAGKFSDFHLRIEARFNKGGSGGVFVRCPFDPGLPSRDDPKGPDGFRATINDTRFLLGSTGGLYPGEGEMVSVDHKKVTKVPSGQWFTLEVIADNQTLAVLVNEEPSGYKFAPKRLRPSGHIALQQFGPGTVIEFRKIEIEELKPPDRKDSRPIGRVLSRMNRVARVAFLPDGAGLVAGGSSSEFTKKTEGPYRYSTPPSTLELLPVENRQHQRTMRGVGVAISALAISSDGSQAASSPAPSRTECRLDLGPQNGTRSAPAPPSRSRRHSPCRAISFSPDNRSVVLALANGTVLAWELATEKERDPTALHAGNANRASSRARFSPPTDVIWLPGAGPGWWNCGTWLPAAA